MTAPIFTRFRTAACALGALLFINGAAQAASALVWDNGLPSYEGGWNFMASTADDFTLSTSTTVDRIDAYMFEYFWQGLDLSAMRVRLDGKAAAVASISVMGTGQYLNLWGHNTNVYAVSIDIVDVTLSQGTHMLSLSNLSSENDLNGWVWTSAVQGNSAIRYSSEPVKPTVDMAFRVYGSVASATAVPEPGSMPLAGLALAAAGIARTRRKGTATADRAA